MTLPTIHLNGTSRDSLIEDLSIAVSAVNEALRMTAITSPNGRDFYPQGPAAYEAALAEHEGRLTKLREVAEELSELAQAIFDAPGYGRKG